MNTKVITQKMQVRGILKTNLGIYSVLMDHSIRNQHLGEFTGFTMFHVIDDEGFENYIYVRGEYIYIKSIIPEVREVKVLLQEEASDEVELVTKDNID